VHFLSTQNTFDTNNNQITEDFILERRRKKKTRKLVQQFYILLITYLVLPTFLSVFITATTPIRTVELFVVFAILYTFYKLYKADVLVKPTSKSVRYILWALAALTVYILYRGNWLSVFDHGFWLKVIYRDTVSYIIPFLIILLPNKEYQRDIIRILYSGGLLVVPLWLLNISVLVQEEYYGESIGIYLPFLSIVALGFSEYFKKEERMVNFFISLIYLVLMLLNARRNLVLSISMFFVIIFFAQKLKNNKDYILNFFLMMLTVLLLLLASTYLRNDVFSRFEGRLNEDTRSGVEKMFFLDFMQAPTEEWAFGRGIDGSYNQAELDEETGEISDTRRNIETGYLNMLLHGGIVYMVLVYGLFIIALKRIRKNKTQQGIFMYLSMLLIFPIDGYTTNIVNPFYVRTIIFWLFISLSLQDKAYEQEQILIQETDTHSTSE